MEKEEAMTQKPKAWLVLGDGSIFEGHPFGAIGQTLGEVVFSTAMTGYVEAMTGSDYYGQILIQTFPMLGNYGVNEQDMESSRAWLRGYIVREHCQEPSNFRSEKSIDTFMQEQGVYGLSGVDTRRLTRHLRKRGIMNGMITDQDPRENLPEILAQLNQFKIDDGPHKVSCTKAYTLSPEGEEALYHVAVLDFGIKRSQLKSFLQRKCRLTILPYDTPWQEVAALQPNGIFLSDGPGDPTANQRLLENIEGLCRTQIPIFGIGMGHQLMANAHGAQTWKLRHGHRGVNQPVQDFKRQRIIITSQNHGYAVINESLDIEIGRISHINVNDKTCEGIVYLSFPGMSVQFQPESSAVTDGSSYIYDDFVAMLKKEG